MNGAARDLIDGTTVDEVVASVTAAESGCAVAVNGEVVPRAEWPVRRLAGGDEIEILTAVQGG